MNEFKEKFMSVLGIILRIILMIWQLPQLLVGWILSCIVSGTYCEIRKGIVFIYSENMKGGISLGNVVILGVGEYHNGFDKAEKHEAGHSIQSLILGPLYLFVIGIPSIVWAILYGWVIEETPNGYYKFYTERWADKLGKVTRN